MKKNKTSLFLIASSFALFSCGKSPSDEYSPNAITNEIGEIHHIYAKYKDKKVGDRRKEIDYDNSYFDFENSFEVVVVGKKGSLAIPMKTPSHSGYDVKASFKGYENKEEEGIEIDDSIPKPHDAGNYHYEFDYGGHTDYLNFVINRGIFNEDVQVVIPKMEYLSNYASPYMINLPDDDSIKVDYEWREFNGEWKPYDFKETEINSTFDSMDGLFYHIKANLYSKNYYKDSRECSFSVNPHKLNEENLRLTNKNLSFDYIPRNSWGNAAATLSDYDQFLSQSTSTYFGDELISGTYSFVERDKEIDFTGKFTTKIQFVPDYIYHYTQDPVYFDVDVNINKLKIIKPTMTGDSYRGGEKCFAYYEWDGIDSEYFDTHYKDKNLINLEYGDNRYPGTYQVTVSLADPNISWMDGTNDSYVDEYTIRKAYVHMPSLWYEFSSNPSSGKREIKDGETISLSCLSSQAGYYYVTPTEQLNLFWRSYNIDPDTGKYNYHPLNYNFGFYIDDNENIRQSGSIIILDGTESVTVDASFRFIDPYTDFSIDDVHVSLRLEISN